MPDQDPNHDPNHDRSQDPNQDAVKRTLSEISHLFLSDVRDRQTGGAPRPRRIPPGQRPPVPPAQPGGLPGNTDKKPLGPSAATVAAHDGAETNLAPAPPVTAVIAAHVAGGQSVRVRQYARHLAASLGRIGLIEIDGPDLRISCFEPPCAAPTANGFHSDQAASPEITVDDPRSLAEAIEELGWDVRQWLLAPYAVRTAEIRSLLRGVRRWTVLSTCDHDGVVSSYRTIKGLCDAVGDTRPRLTLSLLDTASRPEMARVYAKLSGVCRQFLNWPLGSEPTVTAAPEVTENPVLVFHGTAEAAEAAEPWDVLADLVARADNSESEAVAPANDAANDFAVPALFSAAPGASEADPGEARQVQSQCCGTGVPPVSPENHRRDACATDSVAASGRGEHSVASAAEKTRPQAQGDGSAPSVADSQRRPESKRASNRPIRSATPFGDDIPAELSADGIASRAPDPGSEARDVCPPASNAVRLAPPPAIPPQVALAPSCSAASEVLEISSDGTADSILAAILSRPESGLVECPVRTPMCPSARLTIDRDRRVILLAVAREGLADLRSIGQAYRWLIENRALIAMAVPQLAIDPRQFPRLRLLVDPADASADALQPMLEGGHVTVQAYRRVRWGGRMGLLLDAA